jgi:hypothetical protein
VKVFDSCAVRGQEEKLQAANMINSYTQKKRVFAGDTSTSVRVQFPSSAFSPIHIVSFGFAEDSATYLGNHWVTDLNLFQRFQ